MSVRLSLSSFLLAIVLATALLMLAGMRAADAAFPGLNGRIVYEREGDIWTMDSDGSDRRNLMPGLNNHSELPAWSPDSTKIVFVRVTNVSPPADPEEIFVMNADGSGVRRITHNTAWDLSPAWSPDGRKIVFLRLREGTIPGDNDWDIWTMNADGSGERRLTNTPNDDYTPAWSPDGRQIAFSRGGLLYVMNSDGSDQRPLANGGGLGFAPNWSPDGTRLVFNGRRYRAGESGQDEISTINANGTGERFLTDNTAIHDLNPAFSPNGRFVVFMSCPFEDDSMSTTSCSIRKMRSDGSSQVNLTNPPLGTFYYSPDWQPLPAFLLDNHAITIPFRDIVRISGRFTYGGQPVVSGKRLSLWEQPANSFKDFAPVPGAETMTDKDGSFSFDKVQPKANSNYQVRFAGEKEAGLKPAMSAIKPVDVRVLVSLGLSTKTLSPGKTLVMSGEVEPAHNGEVVLTIKREGERVAQKRVPLNEDSRYSFAYEPQKAGEYSVVARYPSDRDHASGQSHSRSFEVLE